MELHEALALVNAWRNAPKMGRPSPATTLAVATALADTVTQLEQQLHLAVGREVLIERGNMDRGPESGLGYGRRVPAVIEEVAVGLGPQVRCKLLVDDPAASMSPKLAGESGVWSLSQIQV